MCQGLMHMSDNLNIHNTCTTDKTLKWISKISQFQTQKVYCWSGIYKENYVQFLRNYNEMVHIIYKLETYDQKF